MGKLIWNFMVHPLLGEEDFALLPRWLCIAAHIVVQEEGESPPSTRRSRLSQNDDPSLCANPLKILVVLASSIGGDRLFLWNRFAVQTTAPSGSGMSESGW